MSAAPAPETVDEGPNGPARWGASSPGPTTRPIPTSPPRRRWTSFWAGRSRAGSSSAAPGGGAALPGAGDHLILGTPTGSGKSLVALGMCFMSVCTDRRAYYTAPIKALVSEKFFDLVDLLAARTWA